MLTTHHTKLDVCEWDGSQALHSRTVGEFHNPLLALLSTTGTEQLELLLLGETVKTYTHSLRHDLF